MQLGIAGVVVVVMRTGGADGIDISIDQKERPKANQKEQQAGHPTRVFRQFRQQAEQRDSHQDSGTERHHQAGPLPQGGQPQAERGAGESDSGGKG